jgi:hypothetical protein
LPIAIAYNIKIVSAADIFQVQQDMLPLAAMIIRQQMTLGYLFSSYNPHKAAVHISIMYFSS